MKCLVLICMATHIHIIRYICICSYVHTDIYHKSVNVFPQRRKQFWSKAPSAQRHRNFFLRIIIPVDSCWLLSLIIASQRIMLVMFIDTLNIFLIIELLNHRSPKHAYCWYFVVAICLFIVSSTSWYFHVSLNVSLCQKNRRWRRGWSERHRRR